MSSALAVRKSYLILRTRYSIPTETLLETNLWESSDVQICVGIRSFNLALHLC